MNLFRRKRDKAPAVDNIHAGYRRSPQQDISTLWFGPSGTRQGRAECWVPADWCEHDKPPTLCRQCNEDGTW